MPALLGSWARCLEGLRQPHTKLQRPITFDHGVAKGRDDVVLVHLNRREESVTRVQQWLYDATPIEASDALLEPLRARLDRANAGILQSVDARSKDRLKFLANTLQTRKQQEIGDIGAVLDELEKAIQGELKKDQQPEQLPLFSEDERTQVRRDTAALAARLVRIPAERVQEIEAIEWTAGLARMHVNMAFVRSPDGVSVECCGRGLHCRQPSLGCRCRTWAPGGSLPTPHQQVTMAWTMVQDLRMMCTTSPCGPRRHAHASIGRLVDADHPPGAAA